MKKVYFYAICLLTLASCNFLNQPVYDDFTDDEFWKNEDQARSFFYGFYPSVFAGYGSGYSHGPFLMGQTTNDDVVSDKQQQDLTPTVIPVSDGSWSFSNIRRANYALENVPRINASQSAISHWQGVARFFRACYYANLVFTYGDVPFFDHVPATNEAAYIYKDREPRAYVDSLIMEDFRFAMANVREDDGVLQVNKYVVAGIASRFMLREGTFLKYHAVDLNRAEQCLCMARDAALMVMNSGKYQIAPSYKSLFTSDDLSGNPEIIMHRHYADGVLSHSTLTYSFTEAQAGLSKSLAEAFVLANGKPVYMNNLFWIASTDSAFFANRDPRLTFCIRPHYYIKGTECAPFGYALSGYSWSKFCDDDRVADKPATWSGSNNITDAPCLRYAEVLLNFAEAEYELAELNPSTYTFTTGTLNMSLNLIRARADVNLPPLTVDGEYLAVNGEQINDPVRLQLEADPIDKKPVSPILWEIRRERRVELCMEGFRLNDLKRWYRLDYLWNDCNPDIRYGAYIELDNYPTRDKEIVLEDPLANAGYILRNTEGARQRPTDRNYVNPVPSGQITLYKNHGYTLTQTKEWK